MCVSLKKKRIQEPLYLNEIINQRQSSLDPEASPTHVQVTKLKKKEAMVSLGFSSEWQT
jgi:hypothetical protein